MLPAKNEWYPVDEQQNMPKDSKEVEVGEVKE
jgi:hypothetical protein